MTAFVELFLIGALTLILFVSTMYASHRYQEATHLILSGVWSGAPLPLWHRRRQVFGTLVNWGSFIVAETFVLGVVFLMMRTFASDERVAQVALLPAIVSFFCAVWTLLLFPLRVRRCLRYLDALPGAARKAP